MLKGLFQKIFKVAAEPVEMWQHPVLGELHWADDRECWVGVCQGMQYSLAYTGPAEPSKSQVEHAEFVFSDLTILNTAFILSRSQAVRDFGEHLRDEIMALELTSIDFSEGHSGVEMKLPMLGGKMGRNWVANFSGIECTGITYKSSGDLSASKKKSR